MEKKYLELGAIIKNARLEKKLSQADLARKLNRSRALLNHFEKGNEKPGLVDAFKLELILGLESKPLSGFIIREAYREAGGEPSAKIGGENPASGISLKTAFRSEKSEGEVTSVPIVIEVPVKLPEIILKLKLE